MELPINEDDNSRRILETGKYQLEGSKGKEDVWLIRYLKTEGYSGYEDIYTIWCRIAPQKYPDLNDEEMRRLFKKLWDRANKRKKDYGIFEFEIFQEEIDEINTVRMVPWYKEYALLVLAYYKILGREKIELRNIPSTLLFKLLTKGKPRSRDKLRVREKMEDTGLMSIDTRNFAASLNYQKRKGKSLGVFTQIQDVVSLFPLLKYEMVCKRCGRVFEYNSKTKRTVCLDCWKKKEAERSAKNRKIQRNGDFSIK